MAASTQVHLWQNEMNDQHPLFKTQPFRHQFDCLTRFGPREFFALLAEQGTGKSWIIVNNGAQLWGAGDLDGILILAPNGVHYNWVLREIPIHMPDWVRYTCAAYVAAPNKADKKAMKLLLEERDPSVLRILTANTESLQHKSGIKFVTEFAESCGRLMIAVDESSDYKNPSATRSKELMKLKAHAKYRRILDGTPITNAPFDAFNQFMFLDESILQTTSYYAFKAEYAEMLPEEHGLLRHIIDKKTRMSGADKQMLEQEVSDLHTMICANGRPELMLTMDSIRLALDAENYKGIINGVQDLRDMFSPNPSPRKTAALQTMASIDARLGAHLRSIASASNPKRLPQIVERDKEGKPKYRNLEKLNRLIAPHSFRVLKRDCLGLPKKIYKIVWFDMTKEQQHAYDLAAEKNRLALDGEETAFNKLVTQMKLMQITSGYYIHPDADEPVRIPGRNPKLELLVERAKALIEQDKKLIIWARYRVQIEDVCKALRAEGMRVVEYHGGIGKGERQDAIEEFERGEAQVFVAQQQAGGKGLTLVACHNVFYFSNDYSLRNRLQSEDRAHRIGQEEDVIYTDFCARNTVDAECVDQLRDKEFIAQLIVGDERLEKSVTDDEC